MSYYSTTHSTLLFNLTAYSTFLSLENASLSTPDFNVTTTIAAIFEGPPTSPYNLTQKIIIGIVFTLLSLLTVMGNCMVSWTHNFIKTASMSAASQWQLSRRKHFHLMHVFLMETEAFPSTPWQLFLKTRTDFWWWKLGMRCGWMEKFSLNNWSDRNLARFLG